MDAHHGRASLALHAEGGTKRARSGRLAIPSRRIKRTATGKVPVGQKPSAVLAKRRGFIGRIERGAEAIWRHSPRGGLVLLYTLAPSARLRKRFRFYEDAHRVAASKFSPLFRQSLARAIRTAR